jgi:hypothetical protein
MLTSTPNLPRTLDADHSRLEDNAGIVAAKPGKFASERLGLVLSYGIKWDKAATDWPNLHATRTIGRQKIDANFRNQMGLYILYERNEPQYIGIADRLGERIGKHRNEDYAWDNYSWFGNKALIESDNVPAEKEQQVNRAEIDTVIARPKRVWHDFEAVVFHAFGWVAPRYGDGNDPDGSSRRNLKIPVFGNGAQAVRWEQVKKPGAGDRSALGAFADDR